MFIQKVKVNNDNTATIVYKTSNDLSAQEVNFTGKDQITEDFAKAFLKINEKNAKEVIKEYEALPKNDETLINAICSEVRSNAQLRKDAVMTVYDYLAKHTKNINPQKRQEFKAELEKEFDKPWYKGMVDTENMDNMIEEMMSADEKTTEPPAKNSGKSSNSSSIPNETVKSTNGGNSKDITSNTLTTIKGSDGNYATAGQLKKWAINSAKKDKGFSKVDNPYICLLYTSPSPRD